MGLGFPLAIRICHWFNFLFLSLLVRSGIEILSNHPKLYWNEHCRTGSEWLRFTKKVFTDDRMFASTDEEEPFSPIIALPGRTDLGLGRYWHFATTLGWLLCGVCYIAALAFDGQWRRLIPTDPSILMDAWHAAMGYLHGAPPPPGNTLDPSHPYNALQQLTYAAIIFVLTPFQIYTGLAMSPALSNRFFLDRWLGGRQVVRSLHFCGLVAYLTFFVGHLAMIVVHGAGEELAKMILGEMPPKHASQAVAVAACIIATVVAINIIATVVSHKHGRKTRHVLGALWNPVRTRLLHGLQARSTRPEAAITTLHHMNGYPPLDFHPSAHDHTHVFEKLAMNEFHDYELEVGGLVGEPLSLSLDDLRAMPYHTSIQTHMCIQGWSANARWGGVQLSAILERCKPFKDARYLAFISYQQHEKAFQFRGERVPYYECIDMALAMHPETFLAIDMNGKPLPMRHGAPVRLRLGSALGFKMVKFLRRIELIHDYRDIGEGQGGCREDLLNFDMGAEI